MIGKRILLIPLVSFLICINAQAQFFLGGGHFNGGTAVGSLKDEVGSLFIPSISGFMLYEFETAPVQIGAEFGYGLYGTELEKRTDLFPGFTDELRLRRNNNIITGMIVLRYLPILNTKYTPLLEAQFGGNYLYTRYKIRARIDEEAFEVDTDHDQWALAYRIGAGIQFPLEFIDEGVKLEFRTTYQSSNRIEFLTRGDVTYLPNEGVFDYDFQRGQLQFLTFSLGIIVYDVFY